MLAHLQHTILTQGGWIGFDDFMAQALYAPGLGYYARGSTVFGVMPQGLRTANATWAEALAKAAALTAG